MKFGTQANLRPLQSSDSSMLKQQLEKEVMCLVRQLDRVRTDETYADCATLKSFETMIASRRKMLHNLPVDSMFRPTMSSM